jgi:hypothetical protein
MSLVFVPERATVGVTPFVVVTPRLARETETCFCEAEELLVLPLLCEEPLEDALVVEVVVDVVDEVEL